MAISFQAPSKDKAELETGPAFTPRFDEHGLVTAVVTDAKDGELLMVAHMNAEAFELTLSTGRVHYWSRSRGTLWKKGETSGHFQHVVSVKIDCDADTLLFFVDQDGAACHTGAHSCFYRDIEEV